MASRTFQIQPEKRLPHRLDRVLKRQVPELERAGSVTGRQRQETRRDHAFGVVVRAPFAGEDVTRQLLMDEAVEGFVEGEGVDDVVPVEVKLGHGIVDVVPRRVRIPNHVHPMPSPAFPIAGRRQQSVDSSPSDARRASMKRSTAES